VEKCHFGIFSILYNKKNAAKMFFNIQLIKKERFVRGGPEMTSFPKGGRGVKTMMTLHDFPFLDTCSYIILAGIMF
jgi:hypothetical protein